MAVSTFSAEDKPQLRWPLDVSPLQHGGSGQYLFRDPLGLASESLIIPGALIPIISRFDGARSIGSIAEEGAQHGVTLELVIAIAQTLAQHHFLLTPESAAHFSRIAQEFRDSPVREAVHAGKVYPADPVALRAVIAKFLRDAEEVAIPSTLQGQPSALITPHIDYNRGWMTYAAGFRALEKTPTPEVIFLLGTAHQPGEGIYHFTRKSFDTPWGPFACATDVLERIITRIGSERAFRSELLHRQEHSLELQLPFLKYMYRRDRLDSQQPEPSLVPLLVGSFHEYLLKGLLPRDHGEASEVIGVLAQTIKELRAEGRRFLFHGGVDLAHVGLQFGDKVRVSDNGLELLRSRDQELLGHILAGNSSGLFSHIAEDLDKRRICGFPSLYTILSAFELAGETLQGHLLEYRQAVEPNSDCVVSFASAIWSAT